MIIEFDKKYKNQILECYNHYKVIQSNCRAIYATGYICFGLRSIFHADKFVKPIFDNGILITRHVGTFVGTFLMRQIRSSLNSKNRKIK